MLVAAVPKDGPCQWAALRISFFRSRKKCVGEKSGESGSEFDAGLEVDPLLLGGLRPLPVGIIFNEEDTRIK